MLFFAKTLSGKLATYLSYQHVHTRSTYQILSNVPRKNSELGKTTFSFYAALGRNELQNTITITKYYLLLIPLNVFHKLPQGNMLLSKQNPCIICAITYEIVLFCFVLIFR